MRLQLYYPVKPFVITQPFGATGNLAYYEANGVNFKGHNGTDVIANHGQPIYASHDGTAYYEVDKNQGHGVVLLTNDKFDYNGGSAYWKTIYWHMVDSSLEPQYKSPVEDNYPLKIKAGDLIGYANNTGLSQGNHLHWGLKPVANNEPAFTWLNLEQNNGYMGAVDVMPYTNGLYAQDLNVTHFIFTKDMQFGETSDDVVQLQLKLKGLGYFPIDQECTGYFGWITRASVFAFQKDHVNLSWWARYIGRGMYCASQTREALNSLA